MTVKPTRRAVGLLVWLILAALLAGCAEKAVPEPAGPEAAPPEDTTLKRIVRKTKEGEIPESFSLRVPIFIARDNYSSATTSLAMVMSYYDANEYKKREVWDRSGTTFKMVLKECGNDMDGLVRAAASFGYTDTQFLEDQTPGDLRKIIAKNMPVIVNVRDFASDREEAYTSMVVVAYTPTGFTLHDPARGRITVSDEELAANWRARLCSPIRGLVENSAFLVKPQKGQ